MVTPLLKYVCTNPDNMEVCNQCRIDSRFDGFRLAPHLCLPAQRSFGTLARLALAANLLEGHMVGTLSIELNQPNGNAFTERPVSLTEYVPRYGC